MAEYGRFVTSLERPGPDPAAAHAFATELNELADDLSGIIATVMAIEVENAAAASHELHVETLAELRVLRASLTHVLDEARGVAAWIDDVRSRAIARLEAGADPSPSWLVVNTAFARVLKEAEDFVRLAPGAFEHVHAIEARSATEIATTIDFEIETESGRWIAEIHALPGCLVYGATKEEAERNVLVLAHRIVADRIEHGEPVPTLLPVGVG